jgi:hypothetical protein
MGKFTYDGTVSVDFEDRLLAHLRIVIATKLRRGEPFYFCWREDLSACGGRITVWINPGSSLVYKVGSTQPLPINPTWIDALMYAANSPAGLYLVPEPDGPETSGPDAGVHRERPARDAFVPDTSRKVPATSS